MYIAYVKSSGAKRDIDHFLIFFFLDRPNAII